LCAKSVQKRALFQGAGRSGKFFLRDRAVNLSGAELPVLEDFLHVDRGNAGRDQLGSVRVTKCVRRSHDIKPGLFPIEGDEFLDRPNREVAGYFAEVDHSFRVMSIGVRSRQAPSRAWKFG